MPDQEHFSEIDRPLAAVPVRVETQEEADALRDFARAAVTGARLAHVLGWIVRTVPALAALAVAAAYLWNRMPKGTGP